MANFRKREESDNKAESKQLPLSLILSWDIYEIILSFLSCHSVCFTWHYFLPSCRFARRRHLPAVPIIPESRTSDSNSYTVGTSLSLIYYSGLRVSESGFLFPFLCIPQVKIWWFYFDSHSYKSSDLHTNFRWIKQKTMLYKLLEGVGKISIRYFDLNGSTITIRSVEY